MDRDRLMTKADHEKRQHDMAHFPGRLGWVVDRTLQLMAAALIVVVVGYLLTH